MVTDCVSGTDVDDTPPPIPTTDDTLPHTASCSSTGIALLRARDVPAARPAIIDQGGATRTWQSRSARPMDVVSRERIRGARRTHRSPASLDVPGTGWNSVVPSLTRPSVGLVPPTHVLLELALRRHSTDTIPSARRPRVIAPARADCASLMHAAAIPTRVSCARRLTNVPSSATTPPQPCLPAVGGPLTAIALASPPAYPPLLAARAPEMRRPAPALALDGASPTHDAALSYTLAPSPPRAPSYGAVRAPPQAPIWRAACAPPPVSFRPPDRELAGSRFRTTRKTARPPPLAWISALDARARNSSRERRAATHPPAPLAPPAMSRRFHAVRAPISNAPTARHPPTAQAAPSRVGAPSREGLVSRIPPIRAPESKSESVRHALQRARSSDTAGRLLRPLARPRCPPRRSHAARARISNAQSAAGRSPAAGTA
ncbi:hypothetical protein B0H15DRAFT_1027107 [Mycena belliarum]|uniref:Uncharacterized protein n=1 Tax=Mycena belliarum TaxID=1033014 RepID=A0AAD6XMD9_9AGAR|nr:hypothetical protein B0H15DRAFT_1027107 [Mycena belliae]